MKQLLLSDLAGQTDAQVRKWIADNFEVSESLLAEYEILIAEHNIDDYEGDAYLLMKHRDGRLVQDRTDLQNPCTSNDFRVLRIVDHVYLLSGHNRYRGDQRITEFLREYFAI